jgi:hypothetical protein
MHPEIVREGPGACPICGMALEPRTVTLDERNPELDDMTRRFCRRPSRGGRQSALQALHREGVKVVMLTGDNRAPAASVARRWGTSARMCSSR